MTALLLIVILLISLIVLFLAGLSRHKKSAAGVLDLMGANGLVESALDPEGSVIINGELWRARIENGNPLPRRDKVRVVGYRGHLVLVESVLSEPPAIVGG